MSVVPGALPLAGAARPFAGRRRARRRRHVADLSQRLRAGHIDAFDLMSGYRWRESIRHASSDRIARRRTTASGSWRIVRQSSGNTRRPTSLPSRRRPRAATACRRMMRCGEFKPVTAVPTSCAAISQKPLPGAKYWPSAGRYAGRRSMKSARGWQSRGGATTALTTTSEGRLSARSRTRSRRPRRDSDIAGPGRLRDRGHAEPIRRLRTGRRPRSFPAEEPGTRRVRGVGVRRRRPARPTARAGREVTAHLAGGQDAPDHRVVLFLVEEQHHEVTAGDALLAKRLSRSEADADQRRQVAVEGGLPMLGCPGARLSGQVLSQRAAASSGSQLSRWSSQPPVAAVHRHLRKNRRPVPRCGRLAP